MRKVDFFIVGQPKSGTTALANFLNQHPSICMANPKEPGYFAVDFIKESDDFHNKKVYLKARSLKEYEKHFSHRGKNELLGEATTTYLYSKSAAKKINEYNPEAKIIIILRSPVDMLHSLHMQNYNTGVDDEADFETALNKEAGRKQGKHIPSRAAVPSFLHYSERVKYLEHVNRFINLFPRKNILIFTAEEFKSDNIKMYKKVLGFLSVDTKFKPDLARINESATPRNKFVHRHLNTLGLKNFLYKILGPQKYTALKKRASRLVMKDHERSAVSAELLNRLQEQTMSEVEKLSNVLERDFLSEWGYKT